MGIYVRPTILEEVQQANDKAFIQAINEVYFGRTAGINSVFNAFCDWREEQMRIPRIDELNASNIIGNIYGKSMHTFIDEVKKQFGFNSFSYTVVPLRQVNSFTFLSQTLHRSSDKVYIDKNGYHFKPEAKVNSIICVYPDLIFSKEFSNEENFGIFLHEIGHNFQTACSNTIFGLHYCNVLVKAFMFPLAVIVWNDTGFGVANAIHKFMISNKISQVLLTLLSGILYIISFCRSIVRGIANLLIAPIVYITYFLRTCIEFLLSLLSLSHANDYYGERFADGFAASYGFGDGLSSALLKMRHNIFTSDKTIDDALSCFPLLSHIMEAMCLPGLLLVGLIDEHPQTAARCYSIVKDLRKDLEDPSLSPAMKKQLKIEIDEYETNMRSYFDRSLKWKNPRLLTTIFQKWMYEHGGDLKFKLSEMPFKKYGGFRGEINNTASNTIIAGTPIK